MEKKEINLQKSVSTEMVAVQQKQIAVSPKRGVRSSAVEQWCAARSPVPFSKLSMNTNLNDTPANWMRSDSLAEQTLRDLPWPRHRSEYSSFAMANNYHEQTGSVDVISDAENIKRLIKMAHFENSVVSLMVHRVGNTILLDNFDVHKHLLRQDSENWSWLSQFFKNTVMKNADEMKYIPRQGKTQAILQGQLMYSKFLYHSLALDESEGSGGAAREVSKVERAHQVSPTPAIQHFVPDHTPAMDSVKFDYYGEFQRGMLWTFEDLRMLIGTDLPVFSMGDHPCVSLRLRDASQPINVVTGLDYWLDNLMCNVPEIAMCYHMDGIVKEYELIKTEDIPKLDSCKFDPQTVKDVASNILTFLRNNATKEGHTYWLYKCQQPEVVKLYDLTTLCQDSPPHRGVTPFTVPVGMLLYRLARKSRLQPSHARHVPQIKTLLQTALDLLDATQHAEVCSSSHYLLSDLYIPDSCVWNEWVDSTDQETAMTPDQSSEEEEEGEKEDKEKNESSGEEEEEGYEREREESAVSSILLRQLRESPKGGVNRVERVQLEGISGTPDERCQKGLQCTLRGLTVLERDLQARTNKQRADYSGYSSSIVEEQQQCNASQPIPLKYESLSNQARTRTRSTAGSLVKFRGKESGAESDTWHTLTKSLLLRKASMAHYVLAAEVLANKQYGRCLKHVRYAIHCLESMGGLVPCKRAANRDLEMQILLRAAEARFFLGTSGADDHQRAYDAMSEEETLILDHAQSVVQVPEYDWVYKWSSGRRENLEAGLGCCGAVKALARQQRQTLSTRELLRDVTKKSGALCNELGKVYMAQAEALLARGCSFQRMEKVWRQSMEMYEQGSGDFQRARDTRNAAVMYVNIARLHKVAAAALMAEGTGSSSTAPHTAIQSHFVEACECYSKALGQLVSGERELRNSILWDFSSTYLSQGLQLAACPPLHHTHTIKINQQVEDLFRKAMKRCQQIETSPSENMRLWCKDRMATLCYNLAEAKIYSHTHAVSATARKAAFDKAEGHFKRGEALFVELHKHYKFLQLRCKRLGLNYCHYFDEGGGGRWSEVLLPLILASHPHLMAAATADPFPGNQADLLQTETDQPPVLLDGLLKPTLKLLHHMLKAALRTSKDPNKKQLMDLYQEALRLQKMHATPLPQETTPLRQETTPLRQETRQLPQETTPLRQETTQLPQETTPLRQETTPLPSAEAHGHVSVDSTHGQKSETVSQPQLPVSQSSGQSSEDRPNITPCSNAKKASVIDSRHSEQTSHTEPVVPVASHASLEHATASRTSTDSGVMDRTCSDIPDTSHSHPDGLTPSQETSSPVPQSDVRSMQGSGAVQGSPADIKDQFQHLGRIIARLKLFTQ